MNQIPMKLVRTVFLPVGSPPIGSIEQIKVDISKTDIHADNGYIYCLGELDILVDYISFPTHRGHHLFPHHAAGQQGRAWQALLNLPFALSEEYPLTLLAGTEVSLGGVHWFMVAPRALEMEVEIFINCGMSAPDENMPENIPANMCDTWQARRQWENKAKKDGEWQMVSMSRPRANEEIHEGIRDEQFSMAEKEHHKDDICNFDNIQENIPSESRITQDTASPDKNSEDMICGKTAVENHTDDKQQIVQIVFRDGDMPDDAQIAEAIEQAKAEVKAERTAQAKTVTAPTVQNIAAENMTEVVEVIDIEAVETKADDIAEANIEKAVEVMAPTEVLPPSKRKKRRSFGMPRLNIDAQNNNVEISAFNINIKLP